MASGLSIRAYAQHRGVSHTAVRKALASGRISKEADGTIDPAKADAAWERNSDPSQQRGAASEPSDAEPSGSKPGAAAAFEAVSEALGGEGGQSSEVTFTKIRAAGEMVKVQLNKERLRRAKGEVVDRARATALVFGLARRERSAWQTWPARVAADMAAELGVPAANMEASLERHVREHLAELAEVKVELR